ncbi:HIT domain-containing protein [Legionella pneumophila]|uniref:HIT domain-containing protein n=1 Tax=Legionella pneumophila TaxID=446 RepID=UPI0004814A03|nr:HIT domain-containing protein [Legionella pneumophila]RYW90605.1 HIT domain-containing protein [Legionella pneumophila]STX97904.1 diadenosine tetraphosphate (Ap4A) hydrolase-like HIT family hydrolase [Legionella pneumophila]HAT1774896.1 HIT domain-containing protein [Legionella pneumophila]HAT1778076.1 HIT domain-containing protein [Legionella pneumophila]HAT2018148.1 HIT domain-containing protein [Legionella pneumophila]
MFCIDDRIKSSSFIIGEWPLSTVLLKNDASYPWFILVPRRMNIQEIHQLEKSDRFLLIEEINQLSLLASDYFKPDKLNIGALGNIVPQLHIHIVIRRKSDPLWPQGIWQASMPSIPYPESELKSLLPTLGDLVGAYDKPQSLC